MILVGKMELQLEVARCVELFNSQIFTSNSIFAQSAFIEILIRLDYLLQILSKENKRLKWSEDVQTNQKIKDITDLVNNLRNAACHGDSKRNYLSKTNMKSVFNIVTVKSSGVIKIDEERFLGNDYEDDVAFYYGDKRIYLIRHIKRLLEELPNEINKLK